MFKRIKTEFHIHTKYSHDSNMGKFALYVMCKMRGVNCLAITDHNEIDGAIAYKPWLESKGIRVIVGEEIFTSEGEIIGLFLSDKIQPQLTPEETIREIKRQNGIVYVPHPYDEKRHRTVLNLEALARCASQIDCIEVHNGRNLKPDYSIKQSEIANRFKLQPIVGCDAHCFFEIGRNTCITCAPFLKEDFKSLLKTAEFKTSDCLGLSHQVTRLVRLGKIVLKGDFSGLRRALNRKLTRRK